MSEVVISKKELAWQCRRGMLELDILLKRYLERKYEDAPVQLQKQFQAILPTDDPTLYAWLMRQEPIPTEFQDIIYAIKP